MKRTAVRSRDIAIVGYDETKSVLEVAFRSGGVYQYSGVPEHLYEGFLNATSFGRFFEENIRNKFPAEKVH